MYHIIFATGNAGKMKEIRQILSDPELSVYAMKEFGLNPEINENGKSFAENAVIKAQTVASAYREKYRNADRQKQQTMPDPAETIVMADDSGLVIDYFKWRTGHLLCPLSGKRDTSYHIKNANLISRLEGVPEEGVRRGLSARSQQFCRMIHYLRLTVQLRDRSGYEERGGKRVWI